MVNETIEKDYRCLCQLQELILAAGGITNLAAYLGVEPRAVTDWRRAGKISLIGALLVDRSSLLSGLFKSSRLRPDLTPERMRRLRNHQHYIDARMRQIDFESRPEYAQTQLFYIKERLTNEGQS